jgi:subtilase family serine protease
VISTSSTGKLTNTATVSSAESDTDPSNNAEQEQTLVTLPDLTVKSVSAVSAAIPGSSVVVNDTTSNKGKVATGPSVTRFFLSNDSKFDGADTALPGGSRAIPALSAKQSSSGSTTLTIPLATPRGRYFLIGVADADTGIPETKEKNAKARPFTVALPDLVVQSLRGPKSAVVGSSVAMTETIRNNAPVGAGASATQYYLSTDTLLDGGDVLIGSRSVPALGAKARNSGSATITIPLATTPGAYVILAVSDGAGAVAEAVETNNLGARSITVTP